MEFPIKPWCCLWFLIYSVTTSFCTNPTLEANFPLLQRCPLGYLNLALSWKLKNNLEENPFRICNAFYRGIDKVNSTSQWTWSGRTSIITILIWCSEAARLIQAVIKFLYLSFPNILYLYFVHHSKCHIEIPTLCALFSYWFIIFLSPKGLSI